MTAGGAWHTGAREASVSEWELVLRGGRLAVPRRPALNRAGGLTSGTAFERS
jgi:hypothetical protein